MELGLRDKAKANAAELDCLSFGIGGQSQSLCIGHHLVGGRGRNVNLGEAVASAILVRNKSQHAVGRKRDLGHPATERPL